jgi:hypothetical protein
VKAWCLVYSLEENMGKQLLDRKKLLLIEDPTVKPFLDKLDSLPEGMEPSHGMWNKLYALIGIMRKLDRVNYWIYTNYTRDYDVHLREVTDSRAMVDAPIMGATIGEVLNGRKSVDRTRKARHAGHPRWRYDRQPEGV